MKAYQDHHKAYTISFIYTFVPLLLLYLIQFQFQSFYDPQNHLSIHLILEMYSVFISFIIFVFGWKAFGHNPPTTLLFVPFVFLAVGYFDFMHTLTYSGMPPLFIESSINKTVWFWVVARATEAISLAILFFFDEKTVRNLNRRLILLGTVIFLALLTVLIYTFGPQAPHLVIEGIGPTPLKNLLEYVFNGLHLLSFILVLRKLKHVKTDSNVYLLFAFVLLIIGGFQITLYQSVHDLVNIIGHVYKAIAYTFIYRAFFYSNLHLTFIHKEKAEKNLAVTQGILESFFTHTPDSIALCDRNGNVVKVNKGFEKLTKLRAGQVLGTPLSKTFPLFEKELNVLVKQVLDGNRIIDYEIGAEPPSSIRVNFTIYPIYYDEYIQFAAIARDITEERLAKEKLKKVEEELKEMIQEHQGVFAKFKKIDDYFTITLCHGELLHDMGISEDIVGFSLRPESCGHLGTTIYSNLQKAWEGNERTFEFERHTGIYAVTLKPILRNFEVQEIIGSCIDITKLKKTEDLLRKSEKLAVVGEMAAGIAHEIRNPLTTLKGFTQILGKDAQEREKQFVDLMLSELSRIELITNDFMILAKPQAIKYQEHDLRKIVHHVLAIIEPQAILNNIEIISRNTSEEEILIICDENQLKQVFINLIKNALESMPSGGQLNVSVELAQNGYVTINIKDTGCGIPEHMISRLGEPFYTLKEKGTGLGLMVSFRIIEAHKGKIQFNSKENAGTTVEIKLPLNIT
ncbi:MASE3 domain-containing protein [Metabacillus litoralis]|uniref:MASE3 domain-containing protein n=1 Tax=Metabacillus litoralis TaxID=152268 RepID=UPI0013CF28F8|nr:MASE3 domain-containing protein [Metabacillus litoralis]